MAIALNLDSEAAPAAQSTARDPAQPTLTVHPVTMEKAQRIAAAWFPIIHSLSRRPSIEGTDLEGTDLEGTDLEGTDLEGTDLEGTLDETTGFIKLLQKGKRRVDYTFTCNTPNGVPISIITTMVRNKYLYIADLYAHPYKIAGISTLRGGGSTLLLHVEKLARTLNLRTIKLSPLEVSDSFYRKYGYKADPAHSYGLKKSIPAEGETIPLPTFPKPIGRRAFLTPIETLKMDITPTWKDKQTIALLDRQISRIEVPQLLAVKNSRNKYVAAAVLDVSNPTMIIVMAIGDTLLKKQTNVKDINRYLALYARETGRKLITNISPPAKRGSLATAGITAKVKR